MPKEGGIGQSPYSTRAPAGQALWDSLEKIDQD
ncbi:hypothetical protein MPJ00_gp02 [Pseudomonas phage vB_PaeS_PAO1_HW12]|nr:hypothetical protein MPJ00_gp02 [Pseudomonas phage vB_PaeS_PAO1_HW12]